MLRTRRETQRSCMCSWQVGRNYTVRLRAYKEVYTRQKITREGSVRSLTPALIALAMVLAAAPAVAQTPAQTNWWSQAGAENGPSRTVWAAQKTPETPYTGVNKPHWRIAD